MHQIQQQIINHINNDGLNGFLLNRKNYWLITSGGYEVQVTAFLYHSISGFERPDLYYETALFSSDGVRIPTEYNGSVQKQVPDMTITGTPDVNNIRVVIGKNKGQVYSNIPAIAFIELGHDFANMVNANINKFNVEYDKILSSLTSNNAKADGYLHIQLATEYIHIPPAYQRYFNNRGQILENNNWAANIALGMQPYLVNTKVYHINDNDGLEIKVHVFMCYRPFNLG